jgi:hypothetical protein
VARSRQPDIEQLALDDPAVPFPAVFDLRSARTRAFLHVLLGECPRRPDGEPIEEPWRAVANHGPNGIGHISTASTIEKDLVRSPANRILRIDMKDRSQAMGWLTTLHEDVRDTVLASHGIPPDAYGDMVRGDLNTFLRKRLEHLIDLERAFMIRNGVTPPTDRQPMLSAIDTGD